MIFLCTQNDADRTVLILSAFQTVKQWQVIAHLTCILRSKLANLQIYGYKAVQTTVEEKHIDLAPFSVILKYILITKIGEAFAKFQKEVFNLFYQSGFQFCFQDRVFYAKKSKIITAFEHFIGKHRLCGWQCLLEIIIQNFILL